MEKSILGLFVFLQKKILIYRGHCSISQSCSSMTSKRSIGWFLESSRAWTFFSPERSINQPKATRVCIRSINQSNRSISIRLLFLFCSRVFTPRSYENGSNIIIYMMLTLNARTKFNPWFSCEVQTKKKFFSSLWASVWSKHEEEGGPTRGPSPGSASVYHPASRAFLSLLEKEGKICTFIKSLQI